MTELSLSPCLWTGNTRCSQVVSGRTPRLELGAAMMLPIQVHPP